MNKITYMQLRRTEERVFFKESFEYRPEKGFKLIQRACVFLLRKLGCFAYKDTVTFDRIEFDPADVVDAIFQQRAEVMDLFHHRGVKLLIGAKDFSVLMCVPEAGALMSFSAEYKSGRAFCDMPVEIIPWMSGFLVVPK